MQISPRQDLVDRQSRQVVVVSHSTMLGKQSRQRRTTRKSATTFHKGHLDPLPCFTRSIKDGAVGFTIRPSPRPAVMGVRPSEYLLDCERWQISHISDATLLSEQLG